MHASPSTAPSDDRTAGLSSAEAARRRARAGPNLLPRDAPRRWPRILAGVFGEPMLLLLLTAGIVYLLLGDPEEAIALLCSIAAVVGLAFYQALRSEHALQALRDLSSPRARVLRDGQAAMIAGADVVVGDLLLLEEGDRVAADALLQSAQDLLLDESLLTGESVPVARFASSSSGTRDAAMVRASTLVVRGRGTAVVTAIGDATAVGDIHAAMQRIRPKPSPMQREVRQAVLVFAALGIGASVLVVFLHARATGNWLQALLAGLTLAIANIPEEFPVVLAIFLALGAWRLARQRALVRRPPAIETLGAITVLCTDKTGTLTENRMAVAELVAGDATGAPSAVLAAPLSDLLQWAHRASPPHAIDPMERALGQAVSELAKRSAFEARRIRDYPFSQALAMSATLWLPTTAREAVVAGKGAPETMLQLCRVPENERRQALGEVERMARQGMRVIGVARATWEGAADAFPSTPRDFDWRWLGLIGFRDPLREGVREAVERATAAGINVLMLTGDHLETARAIASSAGIATNEEAVSASELDALDDAEYRRQVDRYRVFSRMQPQQKLRLVNALRDGGDIVAMTGDGVNDAPALMAAHVGIAMGARGTDVAREAASLVLLDDNFVTIVDAIASGRAIYDNIKRAIAYILAVHVPITGLALLPLLVGSPLILLPLHVVFLELIIDPASTLVFEREPADPGLMRRAPRPRTARLLDARAIASGLWLGAIAFLAVLIPWFAAAQARLAQGEIAATAFAALVSGNLALVRLNRAPADGGIRHRNRMFNIVSAGAAAMLFLILAAPPVARRFHFVLPPAWTVLLALGLPWLLLGAAAWLHRAMANR